MIIKRITTDHLAYAIWLLSLSAVFGSLYFSEIAKLEPCTLCWYLRILLYPIFFISSIAIIRKEQKLLPYYVLPLSILGSLLSFYHSLLQWGVTKEAFTLCSATTNVACGESNLTFFGFITIPFLGFICSLMITILALWIAYKNKKR